MSFKTVTDLDADTTIALGGYNKKTKKDNPTSVEGYYLGCRRVNSNKSKTGYCNIYYFQTPKGNIGVWGKVDLDRKMQTVELGVMVRASFSKMVPTPNGDMYKYTVEFDPDNTIEVSALPSGTNNEDSGTTDDNSGGDDTTDDTDTQADEDALQAAALAAAERKAKVQALLNKGKR